MADLERVAILPESTAAATRALARAKANGTLEERDGGLFVEGVPVAVLPRSVEAMKAASERRLRRHAKRLR